MEDSFRVHTGVHNINSRIIVFINWSRTVPGKPNLSKHRPQKTISIGRSYIRNNIYFRGTQRIDLLRFRTVNNYTPRKRENRSISGSTLGRIIYVCSFQKKHQWSLIIIFLGFGYLLVPYNQMAFGLWDILSGSSSFLSNPPVSGSMEISSNDLHSSLVISRRTWREFILYGDAIYNIWSTEKTSIH